ncbi:hypothetical protein CDL15_Pgr017535 [Punica granatum]|uniref:Uncharacterized protein n=1 Tax=Punica granatum TaxID=22663 RepID=A0A218W539_PUNGR|nr:hypothetical protein CDL15_Pgr017535 [Punica granatum]PKI73024.1 hypothetical protein CRG98_006575 [Punica granatum]
MADQIQGIRKRARDDDGSGSYELELELPEVKRLRDDLLGFLDDADPDDSVSRDLDSLMRSFQDEISAPSTSPSSPAAVVIDLTSDSGESPSELGYLLEASDDDLGLPPSSTAAPADDEVEVVTDLARVPASASSSGIVELWGLDDQIPGYDSFEFRGVGEGPDVDYVAFDDGLFGFSDGCFDPSEVSDVCWRSETLPL